MTEVCFCNTEFYFCFSIICKTESLGFSWWNKRTSKYSALVLPDSYFLAILKWGCKTWTIVKTIRLRMSSLNSNSSLKLLIEGLTTAGARKKKSSPGYPLATPEPPKHNRTDCRWVLMLFGRCGSCLQFGVGCWLIANRPAALADAALIKALSREWRGGRKWAEAPSLCGLLCGLLCWRVNSIKYVVEQNLVGCGWSLLRMGETHGWRPENRDRR